MTFNNQRKNPPTQSFSSSGYGWIVHLRKLLNLGIYFLDPFVILKVSNSGTQGAKEAAGHRTGEELQL